MRVKTRIIRFIILIVILVAVFKYPSYSPVIKNQFQKLTKRFRLSVKYRVKIPEINGNVPDGRFVKNQFSGLDGRFVLVVKNNLKVYTEPEGSSSISTLRTAQRVRVIYRFPKTPDSKTNWAFITNERGTVNIGWVNPNGLGFKNQFKLIEKWGIQKVRFCKGEYCGNFRIQGNGIFENKWDAQGGGIVLQGTHYGRLYQNGTVIWAKKNDFQGWYDLFNLSDDGILKHEPKFKREPMSQL